VDVKPGRFISWPNSEYTHRMEAGSVGRYMLGPMALLGSVLIPVGEPPVTSCSPGDGTCSAPRQCCDGQCVGFSTMVGDGGSKDRHTVADGSKDRHTVASYWQSSRRHLAQALDAMSQVEKH
jgi:hypothetical protein